jgi:hypothetical protein
MGNGAGVSRKDLEMIEKHIPKPRILKVAEVGDFYRKRTKPCLRLEGLWLVVAGILPNCQVCIENPQYGVLVIRLVEHQG